MDSARHDGALVAFASLQNNIKDDEIRETIHLKDGTEDDKKVAAKSVPLDEVVEENIPDHSTQQSNNTTVTKQPSLASFAESQRSEVSQNVAKKSLSEFSEQQKETLTPQQSKLSLMKIAKDSAIDLKPSLLQVASSTKSQRSLMDVAASPSAKSLVHAVQSQQQQSTTALLEVAKACREKQDERASKILQTIARKEHENIENQIEHALEEARVEVSEQNDAQARNAMKQEVQASHYEDEFEYESSIDKIDRAVDILAKKQVVQTPRQHVSVDRDVLKSRCGHGLKHGGPVLKPRTDKLSSFQLNQLNETQRRLLHATLASHKHVTTKKETKLHHDYINRIAKPKKIKKHSGREQYARDDDRRHCKFRPRLGRGSAESGKRSDDDGDDGRDNQDFIRRMEAAEKAKNDGIRRQRAERLYIAQIDKKECPKCGNLQSYSEVQQKRKQCPNCGVMYRSRLAWGDISHEFFQRVEISAEHKQQQLERISQEMTPKFRVLEKKVYDPKRQAIVTIKSKPLTWEDVEYDFMSRVRLDEKHRILNREELEEKFYGCFTYHPSITAHAKRLQYDSFEERMRRDIEQRILRQEQMKITAETRSYYTNEIN